MTTTPIAWFADTNQGPRQENQDAVLVTPPTDSARLGSKGVLLILCDGVGGERGGQRASRLASQTAYNAFYADPGDAPHALLSAVQQANQAIQIDAASDASVKNMASTIVMINVFDNRMYIAHVGDTRAYLLRGGVLSQITKDHNWVSEQVVRGLMTEAEARTSTQRNIITRSLGAAANHTPDVTQEPILLQPGDRVMICCDGIHGPLTDQLITNVLNSNPSPQRAAGALIQAAIANNTTDNVSAIVLNYGAVAAVAGAPVPTKLLVPLLAGIAVLVLLVIGIVALSGGGGGQGDNKATPSPTVTRAGDQPAVVEDTPTPENTLEPGQPTRTPKPDLPTVTPDLSMSPTPSPLPTRPTSTPTPVPPTNTVAPTSVPPTQAPANTPKPQPTKTNAPPPTNTPQPPPTEKPPDTPVPPTDVPPTNPPPAP
jgi:PPM family protein phosphatase